MQLTGNVACFWFQRGVLGLAHYTYDITSKTLKSSGIY